LNLYKNQVKCALINSSHRLPSSCQRFSIQRKSCQLQVRKQSKRKHRSWSSSLQALRSSPKSLLIQYCQIKKELKYLAGYKEDWNRCSICWMRFLGSQNKHRRKFYAQNSVAKLEFIYLSGCWFIQVPLSPSKITARKKKAKHAPISCFAFMTIHFSQRS